MGTVVLRSDCRRRFDCMSGANWAAGMNQTPGPIPEQMILVGLDEDLPLRVADLISLQSDLEFARDCAAVYIARAFVDGQPVQPTDQVQGLINNALWSAGLIAYRRLFTTSRQNIDPKTPRLDVRPLLDTLLTTAQRQAHKVFREVATHHVAHHDSDRQEVKLLAALHPPPFPRKLDGLGQMTIRWHAPPYAEAQTFVEICNALIAYTESEVNTFMDDHAGKLRQQGVDLLYELAERQSRNIPPSQ